MDEGFKRRRQRGGRLFRFLLRLWCPADSGKGVLSCKKLVSEPDLGFVGEIQSVLSEPILEALDEGLMPILSSTASDADGQCYNVNADTAAAQIAIALKARRLVYLSGLPGLLRDPKTLPPCSPVSRCIRSNPQGGKGDSERYASQGKQCGRRLECGRQPGAFHRRTTPSQHFTRNFYRRRNRHGDRARLIDHDLSRAQEILDRQLCQSGF